MTTTKLNNGTNDKGKFSKGIAAVGLSAALFLGSGVATIMQVTSSTDQTTDPTVASYEISDEKIMENKFRARLTDTMKVLFTIDEEIQGTYHNLDNLTESEKNDINKEIQTSYKKYVKDGVQYRVDSRVISGIDFFEKNNSGSYKYVGAKDARMIYDIGNAVKEKVYNEKITAEDKNHFSNYQNFSYPFVDYIIKIISDPNLHSQKEILVSGEIDNSLANNVLNFKLEDIRYIVNFNEFFSRNCYNGINSSKYDFNMLTKEQKENIEDGYIHMAYDDALGMVGMDRSNISKVLSDIPLFAYNGDGTYKIDWENDNIEQFKTAILNIIEQHTIEKGINMNDVIQYWMHEEQIASKTEDTIQGKYANYVMKLSKSRTNFPGLDGH